MFETLCAASFHGSNNICTRIDGVSVNGTLFLQLCIKMKYINTMERKKNTFKCTYDTGIYIKMNIEYWKLFKHVSVLVKNKYKHVSKDLGQYLH